MVINYDANCNMCRAKSAFSTPLSAAVYTDFLAHQEAALETLRFDSSWTNEVSNDSHVETFAVSLVFVVLGYIQNLHSVYHPQPDIPQVAHALLFDVCAQSKYWLTLTCAGRNAPL